MKLFKFILLTPLSLVASCSDHPTAPQRPTDKVPPAAVSDLTVVRTTPSRVVLRWTAVGDDGMQGQATSYDTRCARFPLSDANWDSGTVWRGMYGGVTSPPGELDSFAVTHLLSNTTYYFAIRVADEAGNWSSISNIASTTTLNGGSLQYVSSVLTSAQTRLLAAHDSFLYLVNSGEIEVPLAAYDVSNPLNPSLASWPELIRCPFQVCAYGEHIFVLSRCCSWGCGPTGLTIADALPAWPMILAFYAFDDISYAPKISEIAVLGTRVFLACGDSLIVLDVSDLNHPIVKPSFRFPPGFHVGVLRVADSVLIACGSDITLLGASDPDSVRTLSVYAAGAPAGNVEVCGSFLCVLLNTHELRIVDISNSQVPIAEASLTLPCYPLSMAVQDRKLYAPGWGKLYEIDLADPTAPAIVDSSDISVYPAFGDIDILESNALDTLGGARRDSLVPVQSLIP